MTGLCDEPTVPLEDPEVMAVKLIADPESGLIESGNAQVYATLALVREIRALRRDLHARRTPPTMKKKQP